MIMNMAGGGGRGVVQYAKSLREAFMGAALPTSVDVYAPNCLSLQKSFQAATGMAACKLDVSAGVTILTAAFDSNTAVTSVEIVKGTASTASFSYAFNACASLVSIVGSLSFASATDVTNAFNGCAALANVTFVANSINIALSMSSCPLLSGASLISLANGLYTGGAKIVTLSATSKTAMNGIMVDNVDGVAVAGTAMTLTAFITTVKGWTIA